MIPYQFISFNPDSPATPYWDQALLLDIFKEKPFVEQYSKKAMVVIIPGAYQSDFIDEINQYLNNIESVILIITSDEERKFPIEKITHNNIKIYLTYPKQGKHDQYGKLPIGYTLQTRENLQLVKKDIEVFLSAQNTHERREKCFSAIMKEKKWRKQAVYKTPGFTQGMNQKEYMLYMSRAKVAPSPAGAICADSFRTYEALEAGAIPIADNISITDKDYWNYLLPDHPFPTISNYDDLPGYIDDQLEDFQSKANRIQAWWIRKKCEIRDNFIDDYFSLSGNSCEELTTVIIPVSYIKSHPDTRILEETIKSVRFHLPDARIILTFDGLRFEHTKHKELYEEFIRRALFLANTKWGNVYPLIFDWHTHQVGMARDALSHTRTSLILYVEQDTPLVTDEPIEWELLEEAILCGESNMIRFHFEGVIPEPHKDLMIGKPKNKLLKTVQWSQRPHLASAAFYRRILDQNFTEKAKCFIEDILHGSLMDDWNKDGLQGWNQWRVHIYYPNEKNIKRSLHLDGRDGDEKYDDMQIW